jgi:hypothetical protein
MLLRRFVSTATDDGTGDAIGTVFGTAALGAAVDEPTSEVDSLPSGCVFASAFEIAVVAALAPLFPPPPPPHPVSAGYSNFKSHFLRFTTSSSVLVP